MKYVVQLKLMVSGARENILNELELAWAAGFFDGEGSTFISKQGKYVSLQTTVAQSGNHAPFILNRFKKALNGIGKINGPYQYKNQKPRYKWCGSTKDSFEIIELLKPYLSTAKIEQAENAIKNYNEEFSKFERRQKSIIVNCKLCNKEFFAQVSNLKRGKSIYCSRKCSDSNRVFPEAAREARWKKNNVTT